MKKGFISRQELSSRWPFIDDGQLLEIINAGHEPKMLYDDSFYEEFGTEKPYFFQVWHPTYKPITINPSLKTHKDGTDQVPFEVTKIEELFYVLNKCLFNLKEVERLEVIKPYLRHENTATNAEAENFIRNLQVSFSSDTSIFLQSEKGKFQEFTCNDIGFKPTSKTWKILIEILHDSNHQYYVGIYDKTKDPVKIKDYDKKIANMRNFSKKFVSFLNQTYGTQIPKNFNVFENKHRTRNDRPGTYAAKFKIAQHDVDIKELSKDKILGIINDLTKQITNEESEKAKDRLCKQVKPYVDHALSKDWITQKEYTEMIMPDCETPSKDDAMLYLDDRKPF